MTRERAASHAPQMADTWSPPKCASIETVKVSMPSHTRFLAEVIIAALLVALVTVAIFVR